MGLDNIRASSQLVLPVDYDEVDALTLDGLLALAKNGASHTLTRSGINAAVGTVARAVYGINITASDVSARISEFRVLQTGSGRLAQQLSTALSVSLAIFLNISEFSGRIFPNLYSGMEPRLRPEVNQFLAQVLSPDLA